MSTKKNLTGLLSDYGVRYRALEDQIIAVKADYKLTPEGKKASIDQLVKTFNRDTAGHRSKTLGYIEDQLKSVERKRSRDTAERFKNDSYQAGLANVIKMMEYGAIKTKDDLNRILDTYKGDTFSMEMFRTILTEKDSPLRYEIPEDKTGEYMDYLKTVRDNIDKYVGVETDLSHIEKWNRDPKRIGLTMMGMCEYIETNLSNDLGPASADAGGGE